MSDGVVTDKVGNKMLKNKIGQFIVLAETISFVLGRIGGVYFLGKLCIPEDFDGLPD